MSSKKIVALTVAEHESVPDDVIALLDSLNKLASNGQLMGLSVVALTKNGYTADYSGACIDNPEYTIGALQRLIAVLVRQAETINQ